MKFKDLVVEFEETLEFKTHNDDDLLEPKGGKQGTFTATYAELVETFGEPVTKNLADGVDAEWVIAWWFPADDDVSGEHLWGDWKQAHIYNWFNGPSSGNQRIKDVTIWNYGGDSDVAYHIMNALGRYSK